MGCSNSKSRNIKLNNSNFTGYYKFLPNGIILTEGRLIYRNNVEYNGSFLNNKYDGYGILKSDYYELKGIWSKNFINGKGFLKFSETIYEGEFLESIPNGIGSIKNGDFEYIGEICNNIMYGYGKLYYKKKLIYIGQWKNNKPYNGKIFLDEYEFNLLLNNLKINNLEILNYPIPYYSLYFTQCENCYCNKNNKNRCTHLNVCKRCANKLKYCKICNINLIS